MTLCPAIVTFVGDMSSAGEPAHTTAAPSVFISYASEDRAAARALRDALSAAGLEAWYDENELGGGDAWDHKIRKQIRDCTYFMPVISAKTEARHEGYFRREWRLAVERTLDMADDVTFLLPIVIDGTNQASARVPEKFLTVQWLPVPGGIPTPGFEALCRRLMGGPAATPPPAPSRTPPRRSVPPPLGQAQAAPPPASGHHGPVYPPFPHEEPGQKVRYFAMIIGWVFRAFPIWFKSLPKWLRGLAILCLVIGALDRCGSDKERTVTPTRAPGASAGMNQAEKKAYGEYEKQLKDAHSLGDFIAASQKLGTEMSKAKGTADTAPKMEAIPFLNNSGDSTAGSVAEQVFTKAVTALQTAHPTSFSIDAKPLTAFDPTEAKQRAKDAKASYLIYGAVEGTGANQRLIVTVLSTEDEDETWTKSYPLQGLDVSAVSSEIFKHASDDVN